MKVGGKLHAPAALHLEENPVTPWIWGWVGPRACLELLEKRKIPVPSQTMNRKTSSLQPIRNTDLAIQTPKMTAGKEVNKKNNSKYTN
jgi:hypothetical protein